MYLETEYAFVEDASIYGFSNRVDYLLYLFFYS